MAIGMFVVPTDMTSSEAGRVSKAVPRKTPSAIAAKIQTVR